MSPGSELQWRGAQGSTAAEVAAGTVVVGAAVSGNISAGSVQVNEPQPQPWLHGGHATSLPVHADDCLFNSPGGQIVEEWLESVVSAYDDAPAHKPLTTSPPLEARVIGRTSHGADAASHQGGGRVCACVRRALCRRD